MVQRCCVMLGTRHVSSRTQFPLRQRMELDTMACDVTARADVLGQLTPLGFCCQPGWLQKLRLALALPTKTLKPCGGDSVDFHCDTSIPATHSVYNWWWPCTSHRWRSESLVEVWMMGSPARSELCDSVGTISRQLSSFRWPLWKGVDAINSSLLTLCLPQPGLRQTLLENTPPGGFVKFQERVSHWWSEKSLEGRLWGEKWASDTRGNWETWDLVPSAISLCHDIRQAA